MLNKTLQKTTIFEKQKDFNSKSFRIPFLTTTKKGTIIAGGDVRYVDSSDYNQIDIAIARSEDGGKTWIDKQIILKNNQIMEHSRKMDGCIVVDHNTGRIFVFALVVDTQYHLDIDNNQKQSFVYVYSDDDGKTWSYEISLKHFYDKDCILFFECPGNGIQLKDGTLVIPVQRWVENTQKHRSFASLVYSKDGGKTWHKSESFIDVYTSESSIIERGDGEIIMSCRSPLTNARGFYKTTDLGKTWQEIQCHNTILEYGGCQSPLYKFVAPNGKTYYLHMAVQQTNSFWERDKLTLFASEDCIYWNKISEIVHQQNHGYSCITYDEKTNGLYCLTEYDDGLHFYNMTCFLPNIMANIQTYDSQAISKINKYPTYSQGHYFNITEVDNWYKIATIKLKKDAFCFLKLNFLGFNTDTNITLKINQKEISDNLDYIQLNTDRQHKIEAQEAFAIVPIEQKDGYFKYNLFYKQNQQDKISVSVLNSLCSSFDNAYFKINTNFQDNNIRQKYFASLPNSFNNLGNIIK